MNAVNLQWPPNPFPVVDQVMTQSYSQLVSDLEPYQQTDVLRFWDELSEAERTRLESELATVDFPTIQAVLKKVDGTNSESTSEPSRAEIATAPANVCLLYTSPSPRDRG